MPGCFCSPYVSQLPESCGVAPAPRVEANLNEALTEGGRGDPVARENIRCALVVVE
jgi:hypothetical protein